MRCLIIAWTRQRPSDWEKRKNLKGLHEQGSKSDPVIISFLRAAQALLHWAQPEKKTIIKCYHCSWLPKASESVVLGSPEAVCETGGCSMELQEVGDVPGLRGGLLRPCSLELSNTHASICSSSSCPPCPLPLCFPKRSAM